jgi:hypothetical protein
MIQHFFQICIIQIRNIRAQPFHPPQHTPANVLTISLESMHYSHSPTSKQACPPLRGKSLAD